MPYNIYEPKFKQDCDPVAVFLELDVLYQIHPNTMTQELDYQELSSVCG